MFHEFALSAAVSALSGPGHVGCICIKKGQGMCPTFIPGYSQSPSLFSDYIVRKIYLGLFRFVNDFTGLHFIVLLQRLREESPDLQAEVLMKSLTIKG